MNPEDTPVEEPEVGWVSDNSLYQVLVSDGIYTLFDDPEGVDVTETFWIGDLGNLKDLYSLLGKIIEDETKL